MYFGDARVYHLTAELVLWARDAEDLRPLHAQGVLKGHGMHVPVLVLCEMLEKLLVQSLVEDEERHFVAVKEQS